MFYSIFKEIYALEIIKKILLFTFFTFTDVKILKIKFYGRKS